VLLLMYVAALLLLSKWSFSYLIRVCKPILVGS
jgi:hypothetical protein